MKFHNSLPKEILWEAAISCDARYDGIFFYAVKTTGIFCRPSCKSRIPNKKNVSFFMNVAEAQDAGYRPCKRCRPDLESKTYDPIQPVLDDTIQIIENHYDEKLLLDELASMVGVSSFHLNRLFKDRTGNTPRMHLEKTRIKKAKELLLTTTLNCTDVGYKVGYQSISSFYNAFKRNTKFTPSQYKECIKS